MSVRLGVFREKVVKHLETFTINRRALTVGMKRFLKALDGGSRPDVEACRRRGAPEVLCAMLDKAWQKDAEKRPAMTAVLDAIDAGRKAVAASWSQV